MGLSTCWRQWEIKANTRGNRPKREEEGRAPLHTLQTEAGLLRGRCGNNPDGNAPQGAQGRKGDKERGWWGRKGGGSGRGSNRKYKGRKEGNWRKQLHPLMASKRAFLCPWAFRGSTGGQGARGGDSCLRVLATRAGISCQLEGKQALVAPEAEGWCFFLFSEELEKTEPGPVNLARPNFLPRGKFFPVLGKHTWLEFACPGPGAQSFLLLDGPQNTLISKSSEGD